MRQVSLIFFVALFPAVCFSQDHFVLAGVGLGHLSGGTLQVIRDDNAAFLQFAVGIETVGEDALQLQGARTHFIGGSVEGELPTFLYAGYGVRVKFEEDTRSGLIFPVGISFVPTSKWWIYVEAVPILDLTPEFDPRIGVQVGVLYRWGAG